MHQNNRTEAVAEIDDFTIQFGNDTPRHIGNGGSVTSSRDSSSIDTVRLTYTLDGVQMRTDYPPTAWNTTGVETIGTDSGFSSDEAEYFTPDGIILSKPTKGINIIRDKSGNTSKVYIR